MSKAQAHSTDNSFAALRGLVRRRGVEEVCEMCASVLPEDHQHLMDAATRKLVCSCEACAILFSSQSSAKFKRIPRSIWFLRDFQMSEAQWESLLIPIELAFIYQTSPEGRAVAFYPGPAGAIESLLSLEAWSKIEETNPILKEVVSEVMALLVNRVGASRGATPEFYAVPIDECYKLAGLIRVYWRGLSGGTEVWREVNNYFADLKKKSEAARARNA